MYDSDALCGSQGHPEVLDIVPEDVATEYMALPYSPPLFSYQDANSNPVAELASRELCRRRLLPFIKRFRPNYNAGWFHADICRRVERFIERVERREPSPAPHGTPAEWKVRNPQPQHACVDHRQAP
ncbi:MAG: hypothetical protein IPN20_04500 [Haliscomenobacter sp.]|nr:hypothetical protein [Haliscomenobacter sp.]